MTAALQPMRTLLLSQSYEPLKAISLKRALYLLTKGRVEVLEEYDWNVLPKPTELETETEVDHGGVKTMIRRTLIIFKAPSVVRLLRAFRRHKKLVKFSRINVVGRDGYRCQYCGQRRPIADLTYDHVVPRTQGGKTTWTNIVTACQDCNLRKGGRTPEQAGMRLLSKPMQPKWEPALVVAISSANVPDAWRDYLYWTGTLDNDN